MNIGKKLETSKFMITKMCCCYSMFIPMNMAVFSMNIKT